MAETAIEQTKAIIKWRGEEVPLTYGDVLRLLCPLATPQEAVIFIKTCDSLQLNPWANECYLIKYAATDKAAFVIDIDSYLKAAEVNEQYDGCEAGIILKKDMGNLEFREGAFLLEEERGMLVGGWAKVYRKDRGRPTYVAVNKLECIKMTREGKPTQFWTAAKQPWMLRKTALKRGLVEAFPSLFAGTLATAEVGGEIDAEYREVPQGTLPPALEKKGKPNWRKFWIKVKDELDLTQEQARDFLGVESIKKDLIDKGWTMERIWNALIAAVQRQLENPPGAAETGEIKPGPTSDDIGIAGDKAFFDQLEEEERAREAAKEAATKRDPDSIKSISELLRACHDDFGLQPSQVYAELNVSSASEISEQQKKTPAQCYNEIATVRKKAE